MKITGCLKINTADCWLVPVGNFSIYLVIETNTKDYVQLFISQNVQTFMVLFTTTASASWNTLYEFYCRGVAFFSLLFSMTASNLFQETTFQNTLLTPDLELLLQSPLRQSYWSHVTKCNQQPPTRCSAEEVQGQICGALTLLHCTLAYFTALSRHGAHLCYTNICSLLYPWNHVWRKEIKYFLFLGMCCILADLMWEWLIFFPRELCVRHRCIRPMASAWLPLGGGSAPGNWM